ncbi:MAG: GTPase [Planctomycetota bacterium]
MLLRYPDERTFTGEPSAEILLPGGPHLVERVIDQLCAHKGVRRAGPGEFSARAYLNGRLSLDQAEGVAGVIAARTEAQLDAARETLSGAAGDRLRSAAGELTTLLALVEAGIDFTDQEDVVAIAPDALAARLHALRRAIRPETLDSRGRAGGVLVVLAGPPSAGKSTLFNAMLGRERAVTDATPGTTRDALRERIELPTPEGVPVGVTLADTPGLELDVSASGVALGALAQADVVLQCDPRARFDPIEALPRESAVLRVRTKADRPAPSDAEGLPVCAMDGSGLDELRRAIVSSIPGASAADRLAEMPRWRDALAHACRKIDRARDSIAKQDGALEHPETIAEDLRAALDHLGELTGEVARDDVIGRVFATFCVGK